MNRLLLGLTLLALVAASAQQPSTCEVDNNCLRNEYCNPTSFLCMPCRHCAEFQRQDSAECAKSVAECGACLPGFFETRNVHVYAPCVEQSAAEAEGASPGSGLPAYVWIPMLIGLLLVLGALVFICLRKHMRLSVKVCTSTTGLPVFTDLESGGAGSAAGEERPPPYNNYVPVRPSSPDPAPATDHTASYKHHAHDEAYQPFVGRTDRFRENNLNQEATPYSDPHYIRRPNMPPSYDTILGDESNSQGFLQDEATAESAWTHSQEPPAENTTTSFNVPALLGAERERVLVRPPSTEAGGPPSKVVCVRAEEDNDRSRGVTITEVSLESDAAGPSSSPPAAAAPPPAPSALTFNISLVQQVNNDFNFIKT